MYLDEEILHSALSLVISTIPQPRTLTPMKTQFLYMISGFFFYQNDANGLTCYCHYAGMILNDTDGCPKGGSLCDDYGLSNLSDIEIDEERLSFTKVYINRRDKIRYQFVKKEHGSSVWVGKYSSTATGSHYADCVITEVPMDFLMPDFCKTDKLLPPSSTGEFN